MSESMPARVQPVQWLLFVALALWLALVPVVVSAGLSLLSAGMPAGLSRFACPPWCTGLLATLFSLGLHLLIFVPLWAASRKKERQFLHTTATLLIVISLSVTLSALLRLPWTQNGVGGQSGIVGTLLERVVQEAAGSLGASPMPVAILRLALVLPLVLLSLGGIESRRHDGSLHRAWNRIGLRWHAASRGLGVALSAAAVMVGPWVLVGSLGSLETTATNLVQAAPNAAIEEILFRGFCFAWLWRATQSRTASAVGSLVLYVAAQGGAVLPNGDWGALAQLGVALLLGVLLTELTVRSQGSLWPAILVHFLYDGFHFAFVDPRSREEVYHWLVQAWAPLSAGGLGLALWLGRKLLPKLRSDQASHTAPRLPIVSWSLSLVSWLLVLVLYGTLGVPGFHPDGFLIIFDEQSDLGSAATIRDPEQRRTWVYETLVEQAEQSQAPVRAELDRRGIMYRPHYLTNMIEVLERPRLRRRFAHQPGVADVRFHPGVRRYPRWFSLPNMDLGPSGVEWNVQEIGADEVWALGYEGQNVIVGDADTGVDWQHPALKDRYAGWDGQAANHNYVWYDPWDGRSAPWDDNGHGTHTTGTMVGEDGDNQIGVAPQARWIACRNMRHGIGNPGSYLSCMEFLLAPFPLDGDPLRDGDPGRGADVVNNSWGCPQEEGCAPDSLQRAVQNLRAAGQMMVVSAGNDGPACSTVQDPPAIYDSVLSVGAIEDGDEVAIFSSRGPVKVDGSQNRKPDLVAPGVAIRSCVPEGYASLPGTSMAGPHVAGVVALVWSVDPSLIGDIEATEALLTGTAQALRVDQICSPGEPNVGSVCACGSDSAQDVPNNVYGWGQVDALSAVQRLLAEP